MALNRQGKIAIRQKMWGFKFVENGRTLTAHGEQPLLSECKHGMVLRKLQGNTSCGVAARVDGENKEYPYYHPYKQVDSTRCKRTTRHILQGRQAVSL